MSTVYRYRARPDLLPAYWEHWYEPNEFIIFLSRLASKLAQTDQECMFAVWFASHDMKVWGRHIDFDISALPWRMANIEEDKTFLLSVIAAAINDVTTKNTSNGRYYNDLKIAFSRFGLLIQAFLPEHANLDQEIIWAYNDNQEPKEFLKCPEDQVYLHKNGCVVCGGRRKNPQSEPDPRFLQTEKKLEDVNRYGSGFVAGTLVHTDSGLVAIEKIRVGDKLLSTFGYWHSPEYIPVLNITVHEASEVWLLEYHDGELPFDNLVLTGNQLFSRHSDWYTVDKLAGENIDCLHSRFKFSHSQEVHRVRRILKTDKDNIGWTHADSCKYGSTVDLRDTQIKVSKTYEEDSVNDSAYEINEYFSYRVYKLDLGKSWYFFVGKSGIFTKSM
ncbi:hypothetical protein ACO0LF_23950 [Undibacterium sp. Di27W]|uniref:hypothetical protein n=1 Tax=Undibacterium sp. Di27W TaxID=3413036 RepID=UPI003BF1AE57